MLCFYSRTSCGATSFQPVSPSLHLQRRRKGLAPDRPFTLHFAHDRFVHSRPQPFSIGHTIGVRELAPVRILVGHAIRRLLDLRRIARDDTARTPAVSRPRTPSDYRTPPPPAWGSDSPSISTKQCVSITLKISIVFPKQPSLKKWVHELILTVMPVNHLQLN